MKMRHFSIYDNRAGHYLPSFPATHHVYAEDQFTSMMTHPKSTLQIDDPERYQLYEVGVHDAITGKIAYHSEFVYITDGRSVVAKKSGRGIPDENFSQASGKEVL